ncbi:MAG: alpha/beta hydrolase [Pseudomonadota bacterium]
MTHDAPRSEDVFALRPEGFRRMRLTRWGARRADGPPPTLCLHAFSRNARDFDALAKTLAADRPVICPDVLGRGRSDWLDDSTGYTPAAYCGDMAAVFARIDEPQVDWVGTSMGGLVGMLLAAQPKSPIRRLVLNDVGPFLAAGELQRIAPYVGGAPRDADAAALEARMRSTYAAFGADLDGDYWRRMTRHGARTTPSGDDLALAYDPAISAPLDALETIQDIDLWAIWDAITVPTLVIRGADSTLLTADTLEAMGGRGPGARGLVDALIIPDAGHAPAMADAETCGKIRSFLSD